LVKINHHINRPSGRLSWPAFTLAFFRQSETDHRFWLVNFLFAAM